MGNALGAVKAAWQMDYAIDEDFRRDIWSEVVRVAEKHNDPGAFTVFVGYEWSGRAGSRAGSMIHRNVLHPDGPVLTGQTLPFFRFDSDNPEDLWAHLEDYEERLGGNVISIPHNGNLSGGRTAPLSARTTAPAMSRVRPCLAAVGYRKGVPMGGDLTAAPEGKAPSFLVRAVKDPDGANLDRVQVVKGWLDSAGKTSERVYDVALSDGRTPGEEGGSADPVGNTVDVGNATYLNSIGAVELSAVWRDPDFDPDAAAFYYVRVLQIPTPRWTAYDAEFYELDVSEIPEAQPLAI